MNFELNNEKIIIIKDFLEEENYDLLTNRLSNSFYRSESKSSPNSDPHGHWVLNLVSNVDSSKDNVSDVLSFIKHDDIKNTWTYIQNKYNLNDKILIRCYANAYTYGTEGYAHTDSSRDNEWTIILYILNDDWKINWAGETSFFYNDNLVSSKNEIIKSILPEKNKAVIFPSKICHVARSVSRICYLVRRTLMFKFKNKDV